MQKWHPWYTFFKEDYTSIFLILIFPAVPSDTCCSDFPPLPSHLQTVFSRSKECFYHSFQRHKNCLMLEQYVPATWSYNTQRQCWKGVKDTLTLGRDVWFCWHGAWADHLALLFFFISFGFLCKMGLENLYHVVCDSWICIYTYIHILEVSYYFYYHFEIFPTFEILKSFHTLFL